MQTAATVAHGITYSVDGQCGVHAVASFHPRMSVFEEALEVDLAQRKFRAVCDVLLPE